jgi:hypothetical protein
MSLLRVMSHPNLNTYIQRSTKTVQSATKQIALDYGRGVLTVNAPRAQGVTGFLEGRAVTTADAVFNLKNPYGAAVLVSLDGAPLKTSRRMLLQVMSEEQNYQWTTKEALASFDNGPKGAGQGNRGYGRSSTRGEKFRRYSWPTAQRRKPPSCHTTHF